MNRGTFYILQKGLNFLKEYFKKNCGEFTKFRRPKNQLHGSVDSKEAEALIKAMNVNKHVKVEPVSKPSNIIVSQISKPAPSLHMGGAVQNNTTNVPFPAVNPPDRQSTVNEVFEWVKSVVHHKYAETLRKQEVDGMSLLTLTEQKLVNHPFNLPYGPAANLAVAIDGLRTADVTSSPEQERGQKLWSALLDGKFEKKTLDKKVGVNYITLNDGLLWLLENSSVLFERQCDRDLFDLIAGAEKNGEEYKGVVVTGNPGIGKSWFLMYCIYRFASERRTVVYQHAKRQECWIFNGDGSVFHSPVTLDTVVWPAKLVNALRDPRTIWLFDPSGMGEPPERVAFTIVASSPDPKNFKEFFKRVLSKYKMPCWSEAEIMAIGFAAEFSEHQHLMSVVKTNSDNIYERFCKWGGIPRYVFNDSRAVDVELMRAVKNCNFKTLLDKQGDPESLEKESHKLFQYLVKEDYIDYSIDFVSPFIRQRLLDSLVTYQYDFVKLASYSLGQYSLFGALRGLLFESSMHIDIPKFGLNYKMRNLQTGSDLDTQDMKKLQFPLPLDTGSFDTLKGFKVQEGVYYRPTSQNYGAIDSLVCYGERVFAFQSTVSESHRIKFYELCNIRRELGIAVDKLFFIFVVPTDRFETFKRQSFDHNEYRGDQKENRKTRREPKTKKVVLPEDEISEGDLQQFSLELVLLRGSPMEKAEKQK